MGLLPTSHAERRNLNRSAGTPYATRSDWYDRELATGEFAGSTSRVPWGRRIGGRLVPPRLEPLSCRVYVWTGRFWATSRCFLPNPDLQNSVFTYNGLLVLWLERILWCCDCGRCKLGLWRRSRWTWIPRVDCRSFRRSIASRGPCYTETLNAVNNLRLDSAGDTQLLVRHGSC